MNKKTIDFSTLSSRDLLILFCRNAIDQDTALLEDRISKVNALIWEMEAIADELKSRDGDQRIVLLELYDHPNAQVRVKAIKATLAVAPRQSRAALEALAASREYPPSFEAGMTINALDKGIFTPK